jgi:hypothetical protein
VFSNIRVEYPAGTGDINGHVGKLFSKECILAFVRLFSRLSSRWQRYSYLELNMPPRPRPRLSLEGCYG